MAHPRAKLEDLTGKTALVTGSNTGIGRVTATELAKAGAKVLLACRSESKARPVVDEINNLTGRDDAEFMSLDLGSFAATRESAQGFLDRNLPLDILVNNAGLAGSVGSTADGFEIHFAVNHLGPFLFTQVLMPRILEAKNSRIVNVASRAHTRVRKYDLDQVTQKTITKTGVPEYSFSKLANVHYTHELAKRVKGTRTNVYSLHPGVVGSDIWRRIPRPFRDIALLFMITNFDGAQTSLHCAASAEAAHESGLYYNKCAPISAAKMALDEELSKTLYAKSLAWTGAPDVPS